MRKIIITALAAASLIPVAASAQDRSEVRKDQREVNRDRQAVQDAKSYGDYKDVRKARQELREDRQEKKEDWRGYRSTHRNLYRRSAYNGPRGYRYHPVTVGYVFAPDYYSRQYWINDPWTYRLSRPTGDQRWIRYGNDVALVNTRNGRVLQVYNSFFY